MAIETPSLSEILHRRQNELCLRLASDPIADFADPTAIHEVDFPGYRPGKPERWAKLDGGGFSWLDRQEASATWRRTTAGNDAIVAAAYLTWEPPGKPPSLLAAANLGTMQKFSSPGIAVLRVIIAAADFHSIDPPHGMVAMGAEFFTASGVTTMYPLAGQDRALVRATLGGLVALLERDTTLGDLSNRSTRSRVPLVPQEDAELAAAVTMVKQRLELLLAAPT